MLLCLVGRRVQLGTLNPCSIPLGQQRLLSEAQLSAGQETSGVGASLLGQPMISHIAEHPFGGDSR